MTTDPPQAKRRRMASRGLNIPPTKNTVQKHPLGVKPLGNQILASEGMLVDLANSTGPFFKHLPDEIVVAILSLLDKHSLLALSHVSKFFYAFATFEEIWRNIYTQATPEQRKAKALEFDSWTGSWRSSILGFPATTNIVSCPFVFSDLLFQPYSNSQVDYRDLFENFIAEQKELIAKVGYLEIEKPSEYPVKSRIPRLDEEALKYKTFEDHWSNHPFIVGSNTPRPGRWADWTIEWLVEKFPNVTFRQESVQWPLSLYTQYSKNNTDESPLYLFDCRSKAFGELIPSKNGYYPRPPCFAPASNDMLTVFEESRPDHTWLITGPARSGSTWHKDPNSTDAWNVVLQGCKLWVMFPPHVKPPGVFADDSEGEVVAPVGVAEWVRSGFWNDSLKMINETDCGGLIGITYPGECIYVPSGWWHTVINIDDGVALTGNFVPSCKLGNVLKFMKDKTYQVSGFRHDKLQKYMRAFLAEHPIENPSQDQADRRAKIEKYLKRLEFSNQDEDVGELGGTECMPVYECFVELLKAKQFEPQLENGLRQMYALDLEDRKGQVKKSETWERLTTESPAGFSFGFSDVE